MKVIIAGSRGINSLELVRYAVLQSGFKVTEVVSGHHWQGVDRVAEEYAGRRGIPIKAFPADWKQYGPGAGPRRNGQMALYADALIALWDGTSTGTYDMIERAKAQGLPVFVLVWPTASS